MATSPLLVEFATRNAVFLEGVKADEVKKIQPFLREIDREIRLRLSQEALTSYSRQRLEQLLAQIDGILLGIYYRYLNELNADLVDIAEYEAAFEARSLDQVLINVTAAVPTLETVRAAINTEPLQVTGPDGGKLLQPFMRNWTEAEVARTTGAIRKGYVQGQTNQQIIQAIRGTKAANYEDGILATSYRNAEAIVRTAVQHVAMTGRMETLKNNDDVVIGYEWIATLDSRTTAQCFVGSTPVLCAGSLENVFRAEYSGDIVIITTASGKKIEGTPNHPVLTSHGFLPMGEIDPGKHIVYSVSYDGVEVCGNQDVCMPATIAEVFDSLNKPTAVSVLGKSASAADFNGDGVGMNGKVDILTPNSHLRGDFKSLLGEKIENMPLGLVHCPGSLPRQSRRDDHFVSWLPSIKPAQISAGRFEDGPNPFLTAPANSLGNLSGAHAFAVELESHGAVSNDALVTFSALKDWHNAVSLEQAGYSGCGDAILAAKVSGRSAVSVSSDNIVSVKREFRSCHVYTLGTSLGFYIAGGIIVHNCRSLDGRVFKTGKGPMPPAHIRCRSSIAPSLDARFDFLKEGATRSSQDGPVNADLTYYAWLKRQPAAFQTQVLGVDRAKLFRNGGLSAERFAELQLDRNFKPLTLEQMKALEPLAFDRAGI